MSFDDMGVFLHYSITQILGVKWSQMMDKHISNKQIRNKFYNIKDIRKMIPSRQLQFVGKVMRREDEFLPKQLMTAWVNSKRPVGRPITTNKTFICQEPETTLSSKCFLLWYHMYPNCQTWYLYGYVWFAEILDKWPNGWKKMDMVDRKQSQTPALETQRARIN